MKVHCTLHAFLGDGCCEGECRSRVVPNIQIDTEHPASLRKYSLAWWVHMGSLASAIILVSYLIVDRSIDDVRKFEISRRV